MHGRRSIGELFVLIIFVAIVLQIAIEAIRPLIPYIVLVLLIAPFVWLGIALYRRSRDW